MSTLIEVFDRHAAAIAEGLTTVDMRQLQKMVDYVIDSESRGANIWVCGNGASASIAQHMACDFTKGCSVRDGIGPRVISLNDNVALMTAVSNDISYDQVFAYQLEKLGRPEDLLIVVSSSGNSPSIVEALRKGLDIGMMTVAMTGFNGGQAKMLADINVHVDVQEYEATEDCHQAIMQIVAKEVRARLKELYPDV